MVLMRRPLWRSVPPRAYVGENRYVGDGVTVAGDERPLAEFTVEHVEGAVPQRASGRNVAREVVEFVCHRPVAQPADRCLHVALLEHQPAQYLRALDSVGRQIARALREEREDPVGFGEAFSRVGFQHGHAAHRVFREERGRCGLTLEDADGHDFELEAQMRRQQPHLETVLRGSVVV
jgi:hypothetical protein